MRKFLNRFRKDQDGAVTVDWVVLTAGIVGLGIGIITMINDGANNHSDALATNLQNGTIMTF